MSLRSLWTYFSAFKGTSFRNALAAIMDKNDVTENVLQAFKNAVQTESFRKQLF